MTRVFSSAWFARHQRTLLWLLNAPLLRRWFRWVLCLRRGDVGYTGVIVALYPHAYTVDRGDGVLMTDFRTHAKYAKRLSVAFFPLWRALHAFDAWIANPLRPAWNLGFDSLTAYPDPGDPGATTIDGWVARSAVNEAWSTIRGGAGTEVNTIATEASVIRIEATATSNQFARINRGIFLFNTAALTTGATISSAVLSLYAAAAADGLAATPNIDIYTSTPTSNTTLAIGDYGQFGTVSQAAPVTYATWSAAVGTYQGFTFNATGLGNISKTSVSKFGARNANYDVGNVAPAWVSSGVSNLNARFADQAGTTNDPKLVITYTVLPLSVARPRIYINSLDRSRSVLTA